MVITDSATTIGRTWFNVTGSLSPSSSNLLDANSTSTDPFQDGFDMSNQAAFILFVTFTIFFCLCWSFLTYHGKYRYTDEKNDIAINFTPGFKTTSCGAFYAMIGGILLTCFVANCRVLDPIDFYGPMNVTKVDVSVKERHALCDELYEACDVGHVRKKDPVIVASPDMSLEWTCPSSPDIVCQTQLEFTPCTFEVFCIAGFCWPDSSMDVSSQCVKEEIRFRDGARQSMILYGNCQTCTAQLDLPKSTKRTRRLKLAGITISSVGLFGLCVGTVTLASCLLFMMVAKRLAQ